MKKISDAITEIIEGNQMLSFGFHKKLFNLSSLAKYLNPLIEARTKKHVKVSATLMNLSRMQRRAVVKKRKTQKFKINNLVLYSGLLSYTFIRNTETNKKISALYSESQKKNMYFNFSNSSSEITIIMDKAMTTELKKNIKAKEKNKAEGLAAIGINFDQSYTLTPGFIFFILERISMQNINIYEISSTYTELVIYLDSKDMKLAFESLSSLLEN